MLEEKVVVLNTPLWSRLEKFVLAAPEIHKIKQAKSNGFFWVDNDKTPEENVKYVTGLIMKSPGGSNFAFKVYPVINGKVDVDKSDKSREEKKSLPFFNSGKPDITVEELEAFKAANNL